MKVIILSAFVGPEERERPAKAWADGAPDKAAELTEIAAEVARLAGAGQGLGERAEEVFPELRAR